MGYTNYLDSHVTFTDAQWALFTDRVKKIFKEAAAAGIPLANGAGLEGSKPLITSEKVFFNGVGDDAHETCAITKEGEDFTFCKTAQKPYDSVVVAVYKAVRDILPGTVLTSDGGEEVFGKKKSIPIVKAKAVAPAPVKVSAPVAAKKPTRKERMEEVYQTVQGIADSGKMSDKDADRLFNSLVILREEIAAVEKKNKG